MVAVTTIMRCSISSDLPWRLKRKLRIGMLPKSGVVDFLSSMIGIRCSSNVGRSKTEATHFGLAHPLLVGVWRHAGDVRSRGR